MEVLNIVNQLHALAKDHSNRRSIVSDQGCLPGLILFLDNESDEVVLTALRVSALTKLLFDIPDSENAFRVPR